MNYETFIKHGLQLQGLPIYYTDIPYIQSTLVTMKSAQNATLLFSNLNTEVPITVVEKRLLR